MGKLTVSGIFAAWFIFTVSILLGLPPTCKAQDNGAAPGASSLEDLTLKLIDLNAQQFASGTQSNSSQLLGELQTVAAARQQLLAALAESNPGGVLRVSLPANLRANFPASV